jgi:rare lipoprotein A
MAVLGIIAGLISLSGCQIFTSRTVPPASTSGSPSGSQGGYYGGDLPPSSVPVNLALIADAVPVLLPRSKTGNNPYQALGKNYVPLKTARNYRARGTASWYGKKFHGRRTSSGEPYDMFAMSAAHTVLPLPTFVRVTNLDNGKSVIVKVNDRGPFLHNRLIDLSYAAAWKLDIAATGTGRVEVVALDPGKVQAEVNQIPVGGARSGFMLQIGAYSEFENAIWQRKRLRQAGYPLDPEFDEQLLANGPPYRVIAGPFSGLLDAQRAQIDIQTLTGKSVLLREN